MTDTYTGVCRYCGKTQIVSGKQVTEANADYYAAANCTCDEARAVRASIAAMRRAGDVLEGDGYDAQGQAPMESIGGTVREALIALTQQIAVGNASKLAIVLHDGTRFAVTMHDGSTIIKREAKRLRGPRIKADAPLTTDDMAEYLYGLNKRPEAMD